MVIIRESLFREFYIEKDISIDVGKNENITLKHYYLENELFKIYVNM